MNKKILILVPKGFELLELSSFTDVFGWAKEHGKLNVDFTTIGFSNEISGAFGYTFHPNLIIESTFDLTEKKLNEFVALAIPGGFENSGFFEEAYHNQTLELVRYFHKKNKPIATVCLASFILGKAGVLNNKNGTTYNLLNGRKQRQLASLGVNVVDFPIVVDGNLITSYGPFTSPYVAFTLLELLTSKNETERVMKIMGYPTRKIPCFTSK